MSTKPTDETRRTVQRRDRYRCAICDRETGSHWAATASTTGNREATRSTGSTNPKTCSNSAAAAPQDATDGYTPTPKRAYQLGYLVHMGKDPATIPVYYRTGGWQQLNADGTRHPCPPPEDLPAHIDIKKGNE